METNLKHLKYHEFENVNFTNIDDLIVPSSVKAELKKKILKRKQVYPHSNEFLPFNTSMIATIRTESNEPAYSKLYPYPMGAADFVNTERLVIDFRKLYEQTIADRYPMRSTPMILASLGKGKFSITLHLKSGYH